MWTVVSMRRWLCNLTPLQAKGCQLDTLTKPSRIHFKQERVTHPLRSTGYQGAPKKFSSNLIYLPLSWGKNTQSRSIPLCQMRIRDLRIIITLSDFSTHSCTEGSPGSLCCVLCVHPIRLAFLFCLGAHSFLMAVAHFFAISCI